MKCEMGAFLCLLHDGANSIYFREMISVACNYRRIELYGRVTIGRTSDQNPVARACRLACDYGRSVFIRGSGASSGDVRALSLSCLGAGCKPRRQVDGMCEN